jgi:hypothetical protein
MSSQLNALLPLGECRTPRTPRELRDWTLAKCELFWKDSALRESVLLHKPPFKSFYEEIYPLSVFAVARYGDRDDVYVVPKLDPTADLDAEIREPGRTIPIEITSARDPQEYYRMVHLVRHHHVSAFGPLKVSGNKRVGHQIKDHGDCVERSELISWHLGWIKTAAEGKAGCGRYGMDYELIIGVDDGWFEPEDRDKVVAFIKHHVLALPLQFGAIHVVGLTERLLCSFLPEGPLA